MAKFKADAQIARPPAQEVVKQFHVDGECFWQLEEDGSQPVRLPEGKQRRFELPDPIFSIAQPVPVKVGDRLRSAKSEHEILGRLS